jgi:hypothetical protein
VSPSVAQQQLHLHTTAALYEVDEEVLGEGLPHTKHNTDVSCVPLHTALEGVTVISLITIAYSVDYGDADIGQLRHEPGIYQLYISSNAWLHVLSLAGGW